MSDAANGHPVERLSAYLDDELPVDERAGLDRHLAECGACRDHLEALRLLSRAIAREPVPGVPGDLMERVGRTIDAATVAPLRRRRFVLPATIAATIVGIGLLVVVTYERGGPTAPDLSPQPLPDASDRPTRSSDRAQPQAPSAAPAPVVPPPAAAGRAAEEVEAKAPGTLRAERERTAADAATVAGSGEAGVEDDVERPDDLRAQPKGALDKAKLEAGAAASTRPVALSPVQRPAASPKDEAGAFPAPCGDDWLDAGVEATWEAPDRAAALAELERLARAHGGRLDLPGPIAPGLAFVVVPRGRYAEFASSAEASGVRGLEQVLPPDTAGCIRQRITLRPAPPR